jgi:predicted dehydrogenase
MKQLKVGLIGTGWWSEKHLKAWSRIPEVQLWALANRSPAKLVDKATEFGIPPERCFATFKELLASGIDVVDIVTGPDSHREYVEAAAKAGVQILCQKPFAPSLKDAEAMVSVAKSFAVRLMVTENWRWLEPMRIIKSILDEGTLGSIQAVRYVHSDFYTPRMAPGVALPQPFFRDMDPFLFFEMGPHWFDTWRYLFGNPMRVYADLRSISPHVKGEDSGTVVLSHEGFVGLMDMSWATRQSLDRPLGKEVGPVHLERLVIDGKLGSLKLDTLGRITLISEDGMVSTVLHSETSLDHEESHFRLQKHFIDALASGSPFATSGEFTLDTVRLIDAVYRSSKTGQAVAYGLK